ncbi:hypothetical protein LSTR_LSTR010908 [Laodelphax striatellus]|uniref:Exocyst complex component 7 n=1 Tax=Laodelphax striatellus TaxID=195883 RepID=A0A482WYG4_LAOST|nr:hypothetical protein LSTR_LSTR010908 [Laodelphax striatellus]
MKLPLITDSAERKFEVENKLQKEIKSLKDLKDHVDRSSQLTKGMVGILSSFEHRLARLEETILPVYNETGNLQRRQQNIEKTLSALDHVIAYYGVAQEVESVVRAGPASAGLEQFLASMTRLQSALTYFQNNNPQSVELENVSSLFNTGGDSLNRELKELLLKHSKPIPPMTLLDLVANDDELLTDDTSVSSYTQFPDSVSSQLTSIADWLVTQGAADVEYMSVYARVRATVMLKSLQLLKEQQRTGSGGSVQGIGASSPIMRTKYPQKHEAAGRRASKRIQHVFEKKANKLMMKASQTLEQSTGLTLGNRRGVLHLENREDVVDEHEMENYLVCVMALQRLMQNERHLMAGIIPLSQQHHVFQKIIQDSMDIIVQDGENIATRAKRCISRQDFGAVLVVFPIVKHLLNMKPEFDRTVEGCDYNVRSQFTSILNTLHSTGAQALEEFIEHIRSDSSSHGLPRDGTVHELTSNTLVFLEQLIEYTETVARVLAPDYSQLIGKTPTAAAAASDRNKALLGIYIKKVISQLNCALVSKSEAYTEPGVKALFRLNNCNHVLKSLQRSTLLELVTLSEPDCEHSYQLMIGGHKEAYQKSWNRVLVHISCTDDATLVAGKLKEKDRSVIKEKFAGFNKEMEEMAKLQRGYSIPDVELRESLKRDNKEYILPKYNAFYDKYSNLPFTKNPEKYVKYTPEQVAALIERFFDVAA